MRRRNPITVEELGVDCLSVGDLQRAGVLRNTWVMLCPTLLWPRIEQMRISRYLLHLKLRNQAIDQQIRVSWTQCRFGGARPGLHCPHCQQRVAKLIRGLAGYCCRSCAGNPVYACQAKSTRARRHFEACKLRLRLGGIASLSAPFPKRPRGMHQSTYTRLRHRGETLELGLPTRFRSQPADYPNL